MKKNLLFILIFLYLIYNASAQVNFVWGTQFGSDGDEKTRDLITDPHGNAYVFGKTKGKIGNESFGKNDGFIVKIDSTANIIWATQIGTKEDDEIKRATVDEEENIYVTGIIGFTEQSDGFRYNDILVAKLNKNGEIIWQKYFGTDSLELGKNIVVDSNGDIYVIGETKGTLSDVSYGKNDCFILHLDNTGNLLKMIQFGSLDDDYGSGITIGIDSRIYICGTTKGNIAGENEGSYDLFWGIISKELNQIKMIQFGTNESDNAWRIKTDNKNNIYFAGSTSGDLGAKHQGNGDAYIQKLNEKGEVIWTKQFGTPGWDGINGFDIIQDNYIIVSGCQGWPKCESFCRMYNENGELMWNRNHIAQGEGGGTCGKGVCVDQNGNIYHAGYTGANLFSKLKGKHDLFLIKLKID